MKINKHLRKVFEILTVIITCGTIIIWTDYAFTEYRDVCIVREYQKTCDKCDGIGKVNATDYTATGNVLGVAGFITALVGIIGVIALIVNWSED